MTPLDRHRSGRLARGLTLGVGLLVLAAGCSSASKAGPPSTSVAGVTQPTVRTAAGWAQPGQNYANARAAIGSSTITSDNVSDLKVAFTASPAGLGALSTTPVVIGDTVYVEGGSGVVAALDRTTGKTKWTSAASGFNIGPFGVALADGRVFAAAGTDGVLALDEQTGKQLWRRTITTTPTLGVDIQPAAFDGIVFASTVPISTHGIYTAGDRGTIYALDAKTGAVRWTFDTVKGDLWGHPEINSGGGAWYTPAIDPKRRVVYFGIANPAPFPGTTEYPNGSSRPGANLYTDSVVALSIDTGKLHWFYQVTPHDILDRDQVHVMLAHVGGRDIVLSAGKSGVVVGIDADTGHRLWARTVGKRSPEDQRALPGKTEVFPGTYGGILTPPATADGIAYVATLNAPTTLEPDKPAYFGSDLATGDGEVVAIDASDGTVVWDTKVPGDPLGGATVVNDLVFTALLDGTVVALDRATGKILWKHKADGGINGTMAAVGDTLYVPVGQSDPPGILALRLPS